MNTQRLSLLFTDSRFPSAYGRLMLIRVLTACCQSAGDQFKRNQKQGYPASLTDQNNGFSIDQVVEHIWQGTSGHRYALHEIVATLQTLVSEGYIEIVAKDYSLILLTDALFAAIAEEWAYSLGVRAFHVGDQKIYAHSLEQAKLIRTNRDWNKLSPDGRS